jgi:hypothetical protein
MLGFQRGSALVLAASMAVVAAATPEDAMAGRDGPPKTKAARPAPSALLRRARRVKLQMTVPLRAGTHRVPVGEKTAEVQIEQDTELELSSTGAGRFGLVLKRPVLIRGIGPIFGDLIARRGGLIGGLAGLVGGLVDPTFELSGAQLTLDDDGEHFTSSVTGSLMGHSRTWEVPPLELATLDRLAGSGGGEPDVSILFDLIAD